MVGEVVSASGSCATDHDPYLTTVCGGEVNGLSQHLQCVLPGGTHPHDRI